MKTESQSDQILKYLRDGGSLTPLTALKKIGCMSLSQRIGNLIRSGHDIKSQWKKLPNGKKVKEYYHASYAWFYEGIKMEAA